MAKNLNMNTTEAEIKAVAKAVRGSLSKQGYEVPHSAILDALATALNRRDWNKLKAALGTSSEDRTPAPAKGSAQDRVAAMLDTYTPGTWALLRLAHLTKNRLPQMALPNEKAREFALQVLASKLDGILNVDGLAMPVTLDLVTSSLDAEWPVDSKPQTAEFYRLISGTTLRAQVAYTAEKGWFLTKAGMTAMCEQLEAWVSRGFLREAGLYREYQDLPGTPVSARFCTDDQEHDVVFDARPYLLQADCQSLKAIIECGYCCDYPTDAVAEWEGAKSRNKDVADGFEHLARQTRDLGFECWVEGAEMLEWLAAYRTQDLANVLCEVLDVRLSEAQEDEVKGRWDWTFQQDACEISFETSDEAAMDAFTRCQLLAKAKELL